MAHSSIFTRTLAASVVIGTAAAADPVVKPSPYPVNETLDRLAAAVEGAGATVFARIDHAKGAENIGEDLRPTAVLIFGNPKMGTPFMQADQTAGLDLPLRVLAYQDESGQTHLMWHDPTDLAAAYGLPADHPVLGAMTGALGKLTDAAVSQ